MTAYVRVRKHELLVQCIDATGTQVDVAAAAGLSIPRINQLYTGAHAILEVRKARALEDALGVTHGVLFTAVDAALLAPYLHDDDPDGDPDHAAPGDTAPAAEHTPAVAVDIAPLAATPTTSGMPATPLVSVTSAA